MASLYITYIIIINIVFLQGSQSVSTLAHASNSEVLVPAAGEDPLISQTATSSVVADSTKVSFVFLFFSHLSHHSQ